MSVLGFKKEVCEGHLGGVSTPSGENYYQAIARGLKKKKQKTIIALFENHLLGETTYL